MTGRICEDIEPDRPVQLVVPVGPGGGTVQLANELVKLANAEEVAAEDPCE